MSAAPRRVYGRLLSGWEALRESYWFLPMLMALAGAALALGLVELDRRAAGDWLRRLSWLEHAGPDGARAVLAAIVGSMITVTGVVFSITIVALTLASSQFGPRLLRNFLRDRGNQLVLGTFVATFLFGLLVLRAVETERVPFLATSAAIVLAVVSLFVLIYFVHHAASSIQASSVIAAVAREIEEQLPSLFPEEAGEEDPYAPGPEDEARVAELGADGVDVPAPGSGYVRVLDLHAVFELAGERDALVVLRARPGDFVNAGGALARMGPSERVDEEAIRRVANSFVLGDHRTAVQDLTFLTDQLVEMAVRALSPGVNDPKTAIACVHRLGEVVAETAARAMPGSYRVDADGRLRVIAPATTFEGIVASCFDPIRRSIGRDADVAVALLRAIEWAAGRALPERWYALAEQAREVQQAFAASESASTRDVLAVEQAFESALRRLEGEEGAAWDADGLRRSARTSLRGTP